MTKQLTQEHVQTWNVCSMSGENVCNELELGGRPVQHSTAYCCAISRRADRASFTSIAKTLHYAQTILDQSSANARVRDVISPYFRSALCVCCAARLARRCVAQPLHSGGRRAIRYNKQTACLRRAVLALCNQQQGTSGAVATPTRLASLLTLFCVC